MPGWPSLSTRPKTGETLGHILFDGPPGLGKTTFATVIPRDLGVRLQIASGAALKAPKDLVPYLTNAEEGSVLFIDEIHRLPKAVEEFLYPAMEDFRIDITLGEGVNARTINMPLKPFTLIGATTRTGLLSAPLRDRFQMREHLDFYTVEELAEIVRRSAGKLRVAIDPKPPGNRRCAAAARRGWPTTVCAGCATTPPAKPMAASRMPSPSGARDAGDRHRGPRRPGSQIPGNDHPHLSRRAGGGRCRGPHDEPAPDTLEDEVEPFLLRARPGGATPRPQSHARGLRTLARQATGRRPAAAVLSAEPELGFGKKGGNKLGKRRTGSITCHVLSPFDSTQLQINCQPPC